VPTRSHTDELPLSTSGQKYTYVFGCAPTVMPAKAGIQGDGSIAELVLDSGLLAPE
jgi:hypothetical protein